MYKGAKLSSLRDKHLAEVKELEEKIEEKRERSKIKNKENKEK